MDQCNNKVTLKMDVAYTDHSHIIGKGGKQIQSVMDFTECHIHFPDCNRTNLHQKSNQVTISGTAANAEQACQMVRYYMPLIISFIINTVGIEMSLLDTAHPRLQMIQRKYNVFINFKFTQRHFYFGSSMVTAFVRGTRAGFNDLREAARNLWEHLNGTQLGFNSATFTIYIDISSHHHNFVMGRGNCNVKAIHNNTGAMIYFPDVPFVGPSTFQGSQIKKSNVVIRGKGIDSVYIAWVELLGYLPLVLTFDLKENQELDGHLVTELMSEQQISIMVRPKMKKDTKIILIKSHEKYSRILFEARKLILGLNEPEIPGEPFVEPPSMSFSPKSKFQMNSLPAGFPYFPLEQSLPQFTPEVMKAMMQFFTSPRKPSSNLMLGFVEKQMAAMTQTPKSPFSWPQELDSIEEKRSSNPSDVDVDTTVSAAYSSSFWNY